MAQAFYDRVKVSTATTGTGTMTLGSAVSAFRVMPSAADGATVTYVIEDGSNYEVGKGVYTHSGTTLTRATVEASMISGTPGTTKLTLTGSATVYVGFSATDAAATMAAYFPAFTAPVDSSFAWINQGTASTTVNANGGIFLRAPIASSLSLRVRKKTAPATPYTITAAFVASALQVNYQGCGLIWRQSSDGKMISAGLLGETNAAYLASTDYTNATTFTTDNVKQGGGYALFGSVIWIQITDNGTSRIAKYSRDGYNFIQFYSETRTTFLTADEVGFYAYDITNTYEAGMTLLSWAVT